MKAAGPAKHRSWYIDFRDSPDLKSALEFTKNIIFETREESDPEVYWEIRHFAKAFHKNHKQVNVTNWWRNQKTRYFDQLREEFELGLKEARPSWKSACQQNSGITHTSCTTESILGTKGLLVMLLHWATSYQKHSGRAASQAVLHDLLEKILSAIDEKDEIWRLLTCYDENEDVNEEEMYLKHALATPEEEWHPMSYGEKMDKDKSLYMAVSRSLENLFANRKKWDQWRVQLVTELHVLASRMDKIILTGMVGQATLDSPSSQPSNMSRKDGLTAKKAIVRQTSASDVASQLANAKSCLHFVGRRPRITIG